MARVDCVIPVYNEAHVLAQSIGTLHRFLSERLADHDWQIVIADNGSTDATLAAAQRLAAELSRVRVLHLPEKGRGRALRRAWLESDADALSYMDVDLSTELEHYPQLVDAVVSGRCDVASGSRLARGARVRRSPRREVLSRGYNLIIRSWMRTRFRDAQCGFKTVRRDAAQRLLPLVRDNEWFFDTELLVLAEKLRYRVCEIPVRWTEDPDTRVRIARTVRQDLRGLWRLWRTRPWASAGPDIRNK